MHGDKKCNKREDHAGICRLPRYEHMVPPDKKAEDGNGQRRKGNERITENALTRKAGDNIANHGKARQDHNIDGGMRIEPEHVLEEHRVTAVGRIEDPDIESSLKDDQQQSDGQCHGIMLGKVMANVIHLGSDGNSLLIPRLSQELQQISVEKK